MRSQPTVFMKSIFTTKEIDKLLHHSSPQKVKDPILNRLHIYIYIAIHTGMRISEILNLTIDDFLLNNPTVTITNKGKTRIVPIKIIATKCREYYYHQYHQSPHPSSSSSSSRYIFQGIVIRTINRNLQQLCKDLKIQRPGLKISSHNFRHYFAKRAVQSGMEKLTLQNILGHSNLNTLSVYYNETPQELEAAMAKMFSPSSQKGEEVKKVSPPKKRGSKPGVKRGKYNKPLRDLLLLSRALQEKEKENKELLQRLSTLTK